MSHSTFSLPGLSLKHRHLIAFIWGQNDHSLKNLMSFFTFLLIILEVSMTFSILTFIYPVSMDRNHSLSSPADEKVSPVPWQLGQKLSLITLYFTVRNIRHLYQLSFLVAGWFESLMRGQWCTRDTWSDTSTRGSCPVKTREWCGLLSAQQARPIIQTFDIPHCKLQLTTCEYKNA